MKAMKRHGSDMPRPDAVGILAIDVYFPTQKVRMVDMETADGCAGKYTAGLGQEAMSFASDREDAVSIALTVAQSLMEKYGVRADEIGHLQVATESGVDRSKSIKSHLMRLFTQPPAEQPPQQPNYQPPSPRAQQRWRPARPTVRGPPADGADVVHACLGGTAALLAAAAWVESRQWDGRLALVVAADVALYPPGSAARPTGGCGGAAILVGPDAPLVLDPLWYGAHGEHAWDFFKPLGRLPYPAVDGPATLTQYLGAAGACALRCAERLESAGELAPGEGLLPHVAHYVSHAPFNKLVRKGLARIALMDHLRAAAAAATSAAALRAVPCGSAAETGAAAGAAPATPAPTLRAGGGARVDLSAGEGAAGGAPQPPTTTAGPAWAEPATSRGADWAADASDDPANHTAVKAGAAVGREQLSRGRPERAGEQAGQRGGQPPQPPQSQGDRLEGEQGSGSGAEADVGPADPGARRHGESRPGPQRPSGLAGGGLGPPCGGGLPVGQPAGAPEAQLAACANGGAPVVQESGAGPGAGPGGGAAAGAAGAGSAAGPDAWVREWTEEQQSAEGGSPGAHEARLAHESIHAGASCHGDASGKVFRDGGGALQQPLPPPPPPQQQQQQQRALDAVTQHAQAQGRCGNASRSAPGSAPGLDLALDPSWPLSDSVESYATWRLDDKELEAGLRAATEAVWREKGNDAAWLQRQTGNAYTASVWQGLASLVFRRGGGMAGRRLLLFSFGSGALAALLSLVVRGSDPWDAGPANGGARAGTGDVAVSAGERDGGTGGREEALGSADEDGVGDGGSGGPSDPRFTLAAMQRVLDLERRLAARAGRPVAVYDAVCKQVVESYGCPVPYEPRGDLADVAAGSYHLARVDEQSRRWYERKQ